MASEGLMLGLRCLGSCDANHLDLMELMLANQASRVLSVRTRLGAKAWREGHKSFWKLVCSKDLSPKEVGDGHLCCRDEKGVLFGFQGRSLGSNNLKYITILLDEDAPKLYGLNRINKNKPIYITEGPFDSTFVENSVAMCGSDVDIRTFGWSNYIWVYDNEPRNREIVNRISKSLDRGDKVIIWPSEIKQKDINDMILAGHNVMSVLECNTYSDLEGTLKLTNWKKT